MPSRYGFGTPAWRRQAAAAHGFTLIEVLVVVAIIALLTIILVPSLRQARNQAQAVYCANNIRQAANGAIITLFEAGMRKERWSTNYGWAVQSLRVNQGQTEIFTCPSDPHPRPTPAVLTKIYDGSTYHGTTSSDAIFNHQYDKGAGKWQTDIQDSVDGDLFGRDAFTNDVDLLLEYRVGIRQRFAPVSVAQKESAWRFDVYTYMGRLIWSNANTGNGPFTLPIMWLSYAANASAGLKTIKGNPALIVEAAKPGVFPESFIKSGTTGTPTDDLSRVLRFRHGHFVNQPGLVGYDFTTPGQVNTRPDPAYQPRDRMNVGYLDGHVERMMYWEMMTLQAPDKPIPRPMVWYGLRSGGQVAFD